MLNQFAKFVIVIVTTLSSPQCNFTHGNSELVVTNLEVGGISHQKFYQVILPSFCPNENSVLYSGDCIECIISLGRKTRKKITDDENDMTQTHDITNETKFYDCPTPGENIQRRKVSVGAKTLNGWNLKVVTIQRQPFSQVDGDGKFSGVVFEFLEVLQVKYNFSMTTFLPYDGNWGSIESNGTWNGMVGQIVRKEAHLGAAAFSVTIQRAEVVDFTAAYHQEPTAILIPAPEEQEKLTVVIRPLSHEVWLALFATISVLIPTFYFLHIFSISIRKDKTVKNKPFWSVMGNSLMFITGSLVQESVISPANKTTRFLIAIWWMNTLIVSNIYMGILVSFLSVPKLHNSVDSLEELADQTKLKWTFRKGTAHHLLFKSPSSFGTYKKIGDHVLEQDLVSSDTDGVQRVLSGSAFIKEKSYLDVALGDDFKSNHQCRITLAKEEFYTVGIAFAIQKKAPYLPLFDFEISNALATGLFAKWKTKHWPNDLWCADAASFIIATQPPSRKLTINDLQGTFLLYGVGVSCAIAGFLFEQLYFRKKLLRFSSSSIQSTRPLVITQR